MQVQVVANGFICPCPCVPDAMLQILGESRMRGRSRERGGEDFCEELYLIHSQMQDVYTGAFIVFTLYSPTITSPTNTPPQDGAKISISPILLQFLTKDTTFNPFVNTSAN